MSSGMGLKHYAVIAAVATYNSMSNRTHTSRSHHEMGLAYDGGERGEGQRNLDYYLYDQTPANTNIVLGGIIITLIIMFLSTVCYWCHRNNKRRGEPYYRPRFSDPEQNLDIYSVEQRSETQAEDAHRHYADFPPPYEIVVSLDEIKTPLEAEDALADQRIIAFHGEVSHTKTSDLDAGVILVPQQWQRVRNDLDVNDNLPSKDHQTPKDENGNEESETGPDLESPNVDSSSISTEEDKDKDENNNSDSLINLGPGIVRMDMSRIMDNSGLPTYEAAIRLERSGYV